MVSAAIYDNEFKVVETPVERTGYGVGRIEKVHITYSAVGSGKLIHKSRRFSEIYVFGKLAYNGFLLEIHFAVVVEDVENFAKY